MTHFVHRLGFDSRRQQARLALLGLKPEDKAQAERLQEEIIKAKVTPLVTAFLGWLQANEDLQRHLKGVDRLGLRQKFADYLLTLGVGFEQESYFESRLAVGIEHARREIPLSLIQCGFRRLQHLLVDRILNTDSTRETPARLVAFTLKITALDMSLLADTYRLAKVRHLVRSLEEQMGKTRKYRVKATQDGLTGLANREYVITAVGKDLMAAREQGSFLMCVVMLDIDHFKQVNDRYGHPTGDGVLKTLGIHIRQALRGDDLVGRYGGEEFLILLRNTDLANAGVTAERLRMRIAKEPMQVLGNAIPITISQGVAQARPNDTVGTLVSRADSALYKAKRSGRDRVIVADQ